MRGSIQKKGKVYYAVIYGHLFNDEGFNRQQVELLEASFNSVRNPLENHPKARKKDSELSPKSLIINGSGDRI